MISSQAGAGGQRRGCLLVFFLVLLLSIPQAAMLPLLDRDEPRFAEAAREMRESGNVVVPTFNGAPRYAKPPLIYWLQAAAFTCLGENAFSARGPSLLATAGTSALLLAWGMSLGGSDVGWIAALAYAFCLQTMQQGRVATADALLIFFTTLTAYAGWKMLALTARQQIYLRPWNAWGTVLALALAGGFLAKGPEALLPMLPLAWMARGGGARALSALTAILFLGLLLVAVWAIPAYLQTGGAYWREGLGHDVGDRMVSGFQGHGASSLGWYLLGLPFYLLLFWVSALPWSALLLTQRRRLFAAPFSDSAEHYLLLNAALFFVIFSLMVTKLPHYTLPAFPFLALAFARRWSSAGLGKWPVALLGGFGLTVAILMLVLAPMAMARGGNPSPTGVLVRQAGTALTSKTKFALVDFQEPNTIWEMRRVTRADGRVIPKTAAAIGTFLASPGPRAVLLTSSAWRQTRSELRVDPAWRIFSAQGWNAAKGSALDLTLVVKT